MGDFNPFSFFLHTNCYTYCTYWLRLYSTRWCRRRTFNYWEHFNTFWIFVSFLQFNFFKRSVERLNHASSPVGTIASSPVHKARSTALKKIEMIKTLTYSILSHNGLYQSYSRCCSCLCYG